ncbi:MAG: hypothetical protein WCQ44_09680 [Opitutaceae bacterium]|jgi:hypothetical protein
MVIRGGLEVMGAKYLPTIRDLKASQRFQLKQTALPKLKKKSGNKAKKK